MLSQDRIGIFGATSDIATAVARRYAQAGAQLVLVARDAEVLKALAADLQVRGARRVVTIESDLLEAARLDRVVDEAWNGLGGLDVALIAIGALPDQPRVSVDAVSSETALRINFVSPSILAELLVLRFDETKKGTLAVITSVAGDRGRKSNYIYGAAKGGLQRLLQGMRHRFAQSNVRIVDVRPGFVDTKMTHHIPAKGLLWASADDVAHDVHRAIQRGSAVVYTPWYWRPIMLLIRSIPNFIFHRTSL